MTMKECKVCFEKNGEGITHEACKKENIAEAESDTKEYDE
jgi:hypothetical protein